MHIAINAQLLSISQNYRNGGISRYIRYLLTALANQSGPHEFTIFVNGQDIIDHLNESAGKDVTGRSGQTQMTYVPESWPESRPISRVAWEQFKLPSLLREKRIDVFHSPANVLPERLPHSCAGVVTLHDLAFLRYPYVLTRSKRIYQRIFTMHSLRRATMIIANSNSTKQDAIELAGIPANHIRMVYPCIEERFSNVILDEDIQFFRQTHGLTKGYLLYLGTLEPRKNITTLIEAFAKLRKIYGREEKLVLAGGKGWLFDSIFQRVQELGLEEEVLFPGFVSDAAQLLWYHSASVFVYPSLYEGFGMPVTEALACGIPVVTSNISSLPEAGAKLALTVEPYDSEAMARAICKALTDETLCMQCRTQAPMVRQQFSAQRMAEQTIAVYEQSAAFHLSQHLHKNGSFIR
ncbi:MAG TPA: glycosyltransferase family 1 protein [Ktedonobacteraceae bacterium]|nr:glycosyltransferase family 1 protein [Ktedonobacteraceae bacterium]